MRIGLPMLIGTASLRSWPTLSTMACAQRSASLKTRLRGTYVSAGSIVESLIRQLPCAIAWEDATRKRASQHALGTSPSGTGTQAPLLKAAFSFSSASLESDVFSTRGL